MPLQEIQCPREVLCHNCQAIGHIRTRCPYLRHYTERVYETDNTDRTKLKLEVVNPVPQDFENRSKCSPDLLNENKLVD